MWQIYFTVNPCQVEAFESVPVCGFNPAYIKNCLLLFVCMWDDDVLSLKGQRTYKYPYM